MDGSLCQARGLGMLGYPQHLYLINGFNGVNEEGEKFQPELPDRGIWRKGGKMKERQPAILFLSRYCKYISAPYRGIQFFPQLEHIFNPLELKLNY